MKSRYAVYTGWILAGASLLFLPFLFAGHFSGSPDRVSESPLTIQDLFESKDPFDSIVRSVTVAGLAQLGVEEYELPGVNVCLHPDTPRDQAEEILRNLPTWIEPDGTRKVDYYLNGSRWSYTATDGATGTTGDPITLTWGFVPDGTIVDGSPSTLQAVFTAYMGSTNWMNKIRNAFERWDAAIGITYVEVSDDGAVFPGSPGVLGTRGDVRISGRSIDGPGNVLAYDYYPNTGDMLFDTDDVSYLLNPLGNYGTLKNVCMHEHGHGMGLGHVTPEDCTKLMEAYACGTTFIGPQDDDIRGGMRYYGDPYENNDVMADATDLGTITDTLITENLSIDRGTDLDWFSFQMGGAVTIQMDPIGSTYLLGYQYGPDPTPISTDSISDPDFCLYDSTGVLLDSVYAEGMGATEELYQYSLPYSGKFLLKTFRKGGSGSNIQRYTLTIIQDVDVDVQIADGDLPARAEMDLTVRPNPFNPSTTVRFNAAAPGPYNVDVYDVSGRLARRISGTASSSGVVEVRWDGRDDRGNEVASGVYLMRASLDGRSETTRAILVR
ncbi:MAG: matrixin family metalloprotease [Candidatus Eisenbacteria bacterium]|nr:matrixin family metalloprotease [Candidatus Eisenbacteria bacterium]